MVHQMEDEIAYRVALIHEVHHRVKNNLQTIISLIGLEAVNTKDEKVKAFARTITSHVRSMNITYDLLSHTGSENVELKALISRITECFDGKQLLERRNVLFLQKLKVKM